LQENQTKISHVKCYYPIKRELVAVAEILEWIYIQYIFVCGEIVNMVNGND